MFCFVVFLTKNQLPPNYQLHWNTVLCGRGEVACHRSSLCSSHRELTWGTCRPGCPEMMLTSQVLSTNHTLPKRAPGEWGTAWGGNRGSGWAPGSGHGDSKRESWSEPWVRSPKLTSAERGCSDSHPPGFIAHRGPAMTGVITSPPSHSRTH